MTIKKEQLEKIKEIVIKELTLNTSPSQIEDDEALYSASIRLDSLSLLKVILAMETEFNQKINDEDVMETDLETISDLAHLLK